MSDPLTDRLADLAEPAPPNLRAGVLVSTGLADGYVRRSGPLGDVFIAFSDRGVSALRLAGEPTAFEEEASARLGRPVLPAGPVPAPLAARLDRAIAEGRPGALPLDLRSLTPFQASVLAATARIRRGEVRPYGWVADQIGSPAAVRAVGSALAANPIPLIIPCHRVVRADGRFGDYSLGDAANKPRLLAGEGVDIDRLRTLASRRVRYLGSDTTGVFCHPTCRHARRITARHLVEFASATQAAASGYRPCGDCRPAPAAAREPERSETHEP